MRHMAIVQKPSTILQALQMTMQGLVQASEPCASQAQGCRWVGDATKVMAMGKVVTKLRKDTAGRPRGVSIPDHLDVLAEMACGAQAHFVVSSVAGEQPASLG